MLEVRLLHEEARDAVTTAEILALHDPLTGLANRRLLTDRVSAAMANARRSRSAMAVVYLDLDDFKQINDTLGHDVGDAFLKAVAERLKSVIREEDTAARLGGDEFMIALWNAGDMSDVAIVASKLVHTISQPYAIGNHVVTVTTSAGVGIYPLHGGDVDTLMKSADTALYEAKHAGKNAFKILGETAPPIAARS
jgi:diguanylate cyclase (GGDEF)-like protein